MIIIAEILALLVAGILFYAGIQVRYKEATDGEISIEPKYVAENKYFGEPVALKETITPDIIAVKRFVRKHHLNEGTQEERIIKTFNLFEKKGVYFYTNDDTITFSNANITLKGFSDVWEKPILVLAEFDQTGAIAVDCESGSSALTSFLRSAGVDAREVLGEVDIPRKDKQGRTYYEKYGHGWTEVKINGVWYLLESTRGKPLQKFIKVPPIYKPLFVFTDKHVEAINGAKLEDIHKVHTLTPDGVKLLNKYLDNLEQ